MFLNNKFFVKLFLVIVAVIFFMTYIGIQKIKFGKYFNFQTVVELHLNKINLDTKSLDSNYVKSISTKPMQVTQISPYTFKVLSDQNNTNNFSNSQKAENCSDWAFPTTFKEIKHPKIILNSNRFLYPGLIWGPNNQIIGLKNSIYLAIKLNRYAVLFLILYFRFILFFPKLPV